MDIKEAAAVVASQKKSENHMLIKMSYGVQLVFPYKDGVAFMAALQNAESLEEPYNGQHRIIGFDRSAIETRVLSHDEYVRIKIADLLKLSPGEILAGGANLPLP